MSQNRSNDSTTSTGTGSGTSGTGGSAGTSGTGTGGTGTGGTMPRASGGAGSGATDAGTTRSTTGGMTTTGGSTIGNNTPARSGEAAQGQGYGERIADAATQAKDFVSDKMSVVGDKFKDLQNTDVKEVAENARQYARQNPGQALLISAAAGFLLGILLRGGRR